MKNDTAGYPVKRKAPKGKRRTGPRKPAGKRKKPGRKDNVTRLSCWVAAGIIALLAALTAALHPSGDSVETGAKAHGRSYRYAVDVSHHNPGRIVWDSLHVMLDSRGNTTRSINKAEDILPISYVIMKASEGTSLKDRKFRKNWADAGHAGFGRGAYHFFRSSKSPEAQAKNYIKAVGHLKESDLPPILDIETIHKGCSRKALNASALIWLKIVGEHYGRTPIVYSYESFIKDNLSDEIRKNYPLWVARYREETPESEGWAMWQFTDRAVVYGIEGPVDLNAISPDFPH